MFTHCFIPFCVQLPNSSQLLPETSSCSSLLKTTDFVNNYYIFPLGILVEIWNRGLSKWNKTGSLNEFFSLTSASIQVLLSIQYVMLLRKDDALIQEYLISIFMEMHCLYALFLFLEIASDFLVIYIVFCLYSEIRLFFALYQFFTHSVVFRILI